MFLLGRPQSRASAQYPLETKSSSSTPDTFVRIEDKFLVRKDREAELHAKVSQFLKPSYPDPSTRFTVIQSLYFESESLEIFSSHFRPQVSRFKIRTRRYAPDGIWKTDESHIELKSKKDGICKKYRFKVGRAEGMVLTEGGTIPLTPALSNLNAEIEHRKLAKRVNKVNTLIEQYRLRPQCLVTYVRQAYERNDIRLTVDADIRGRMLRPVNETALEAVRESSGWETAQGMRSRFLAEDYLVVEVKHPGQIPAWLTAILDSVGAQKASFSKYCFSMSEHILKLGERVRSEKAL